SRNKEFDTIYDHLVYVARQNNYKGFSDYLNSLKNPNKEISLNTKNDKIKSETKNKDINIPSVICQKCKSNIFRSEEHTSELQSRFDLVCRLLLEKKNKKTN